MNTRLFKMALLISALPSLAALGSDIFLSKGDFIAAKRVTRDGKALISLKLSKSGKAKFRKLNKTSVNKKIHADIAGVTSDFELREPILGDTLEAGPYSAGDAEKLVGEINSGK